MPLGYNDKSDIEQMVKANQPLINAKVRFVYNAVHMLSLHFINNIR